MRKSTIPVAVALSAMTMTAYAQEAAGSGAIMTWKTTVNDTIAYGSTSTLVDKYEITTNAGQYFLSLPGAKTSNLQYEITFKNPDGTDSTKVVSCKTIVDYPFTASQGTKITIVVKNVASDKKDKIYSKNKIISLFKQTFDQERFQSLVDFNLTEITSQLADVENELFNCELSGALVGSNDKDSLFVLSNYAQAVNEVAKQKLSEIQNKAEQYNNQIMNGSNAGDPAEKKGEFLAQIQKVLADAQAAQQPYTETYADANLAVKDANDELAAITDSIANKILVPSVKAEYEKKIAEIKDLANIHNQNVTDDLNALKATAEAQKATIDSLWEAAKAEDLKQQQLQKERNDALLKDFDDALAIANKQLAAIKIMETGNGLDPKYATNFADSIAKYLGKDNEWSKDLLSEYDATATPNPYLLEQEAYEGDLAELQKIIDKLTALYEAAYDEDANNEKSAYNKYTTPGSNFTNSLQNLNDNLDNAKATIKEADTHSAEHVTRAENAIKAAKDSIEKFHANKVDLVPSVEIGLKGDAINSNDSIEYGNLYSHMAEVDALCEDAKATLDSLNQSILNYEKYLEVTNNIDSLQNVYNQAYIRLNESLQLLSQFDPEGNKDQASTYANPKDVAEGPVTTKQQIYKDLFDEANTLMNVVADKLKHATADRDSIYNACPDEFKKTDAYNEVLADLDGITKEALAAVDEVCATQSEQDALKRGFDTQYDNVKKGIAASELNEANQQKAVNKLDEIKQQIYDTFVEHALKANTDSAFAYADSIYMTQLLAEQKNQEALDALKKKLTTAYGDVAQSDIFKTTLDKIQEDITAAVAKIDEDATTKRADENSMSTSADDLFPKTIADSAAIADEAARIAAGIKELAADVTAEQAKYDEYMRPLDKEHPALTGKIADLRALWDQYAQKMAVLTKDVVEKYKDSMKAESDAIDKLEEAVKAAYTKDAEDKTELDDNKYLNNDAVRKLVEGNTEYKKITNDIKSLWGSAKVDYIEDLKKANTSSFDEAALEILSLMEQLKVDTAYMNKLADSEYCNTTAKVHEFANENHDATNPDWAPEYDKIKAQLDELMKKASAANADAQAALSADDVDLAGDKITAAIKNLDDTRTALYGKGNAVRTDKGGIAKEISDTVKVAEANLAAYNELDSVFHKHYMGCYKNTLDSLNSLAKKYLTPQEYKKYSAELGTYFEDFLAKHSEIQTYYTNKEATKYVDNLESYFKSFHDALDSLWTGNDHNSSKVSALTKIDYSIVQKALNDNAYHEVVANIEKQDSIFKSQIIAAKDDWATQSAALAAANMENNLTDEKYSVNSEYDYGEAYKAALATAQANLASQLGELDDLQNAVEAAYKNALDSAAKHHEQMISYTQPCTCDKDFANAVTGDISIAEKIKQVADSIANTFVSVEANKKAFEDQIELVRQLNDSIIAERQRIADEMGKIHGQTGMKPVLDENGDAANYDEPQYSRDDNEFEETNGYTSAELEKYIAKLDSMENLVDSLDSACVHEFIAQKAAENSISAADKFAELNAGLTALKNNTESSYKAEVAAFNEKVLEYTTKYFDKIDGLYNKYIKMVNKYTGFAHAMGDDYAKFGMYWNDVKSAQSSFFGIADTLRTLKQAAIDSCTAATAANNYFDRDLSFWYEIGMKKDALNNAYGYFLMKTEDILDKSGLVEKTTGTLDDSSVWYDGPLAQYEYGYNGMVEDVQAYDYDTSGIDQYMTYVDNKYKNGANSLLNVIDSLQKAHVLPQQFDKLKKQYNNLVDELIQAYNDAAANDIDSCCTYFNKMIAAYDTCKYATPVGEIARAKFDNDTEADLVKHGEPYGTKAQAVIDQAVADAKKVVENAKALEAKYFGELVLPENHDDIIALFENVEANLVAAQEKADSIQDAANQDTLNVATYTLVRGMYDALKAQYDALVTTIASYETPVQSWTENAMVDLGGQKMNAKHDGRIYELLLLIKDDYKNGVPTPPTGPDAADDNLSSWETGFDAETTLSPSTSMSDELILNNETSLIVPWQTHLDRDTSLINAYAAELEVIAHKAANADAFCKTKNDYLTVMQLYSDTHALNGAYNRAEVNVPETDKEGNAQLAEIFREISGLEETFNKVLEQYQNANESYGYLSESDAVEDTTSAQHAVAEALKAIAEAEQTYRDSIGAIRQKLEGLDNVTAKYDEWLKQLEEQYKSSADQINELLNSEAWKHQAGRVYHALTKGDTTPSDWTDLDDMSLPQVDAPSLDKYDYSVDDDATLQPAFIQLEQDINKVYSLNEVTDEDMKRLEAEVAAYEELVAQRVEYAKNKQKYYENKDAYLSLIKKLNARETAGENHAINTEDVLTYLHEKCPSVANKYAIRLAAVQAEIDSLQADLKDKAADTLLTKDSTIPEIEEIDAELKAIKADADKEQAAYDKALEVVSAKSDELFALQNEVLTFTRENNIPGDIITAILKTYQADADYESNRSMFSSIYSQIHTSTGSKVPVISPDDVDADTTCVNYLLGLLNKAYDDLKAFALKGDVNLNGKVNVSDYAALVAEIAAGKEYVATDEKLYKSDVNSDESIDVADLTSLAGMILWDYNPSQIYSMAHKTSAKGASQVTNDQILATTDGNNVAVELLNSNEYSAIQMDIVLPEGMTANDVKLAARANGFAASVSTLENGMARVIIYSSENESLVGSDGQLFTVGLNGVGEGKISVENIILSDKNGNRYTIEGVEATAVTAISNVNADAAEGNSTFYNINGTVKSGLQKGLNIVRDAYNKAKKVLVK